MVSNYGETSCKTTVELVAAKRVLVGDYKECFIPILSSDELGYVRAH